MTRRYPSTPFTSSGRDQHERNHFPADQPYISLGTADSGSGSFTGSHHPMSRGEIQSNSQWISGGHANEYRSSRLHIEAQQCMPAFSSSHYDSYSSLSVTGNNTVPPASPVGHVHSRRLRSPAAYTSSSVTGNNSVPPANMVSHVNSGRLKGPATSNVEDGGTRGQLKRKSMSISGVSERGSTSRSHSSGSSFSSSQMFVEKPNIGCNNVNPYGGSSLSVAGDSSHRNVRSRTRLELEPNTTRTHSSSYCHNNNNNPNEFLMAYSGHVPTVNVDAVNREWNCVPPSVAATHERFLTSAPSGSIQEASQSLVGQRSVGVGAHYHNSVSSRHPVPPQYVNGPHVRDPREHNLSRRATPSYRGGQSYSHVRHGSSSINESHSTSDSFPSRRSMHSSFGGWHGACRSGRSRTAVERLEPILALEDLHYRMEAETFMMADHASFYGNSRNFPDQYRDMRLDVDSMSYEELLALGERIGTVSTGLAEDTASKCLMEKVHTTSQQIDKEVACAICLEEYKDGEKVGTMKKCGHDYHVNCIKKWLSVKNVCPICKAEYSSKE